MEKRTVLFVDDEEMLLGSLRRSVIDEPYNSLFANSGKEALEILKGNEVHVLVTDMRMPDMDGLELLKVVKDKHPHIIRIILSGYTDTEALLASINQGEIYRFITKPWKSNIELKIIIRQALEFYELHSEHDMLLNFFELWVEGLEPEAINLEFLKGLLSERKRRLYEWKKECNSVPLNSQ